MLKHQSGLRCMDGFQYGLPGEPDVKERAGTSMFLTSLLHALTLLRSVQKETFVCLPLAAQDKKINNDGVCS